jgi:hypothetical protein
MNAILRTAMGATALVLAAPVLASTVWPDVDFEWYANAGRYDTAPPQAVKEPKARPGFIWAPATWETRDGRQDYVPAHWVVDDFVAQTAIYNSPPPVAVVAR